MTRIAMATALSGLLMIASAQAAGTAWTVVKGVDNIQDLAPCCETGLNISVLKSRCEANKWCAGFSSHFGTLKYSVTNYGPQGNSDLYIRHPPPPPLPTAPPFDVWPLPKHYTNGSTPVALGASSDWTWAVQQGGSPTLTAALARYKRLLFPSTIELTADSEALTGCSVSVQSADTALTADVNEEYSLSILPATTGTQAS